MEKIRALICPRYGEPEVLEVRSIDLPLPGPKEILIRVRACGVNFPDVLMMRGQYQVKPELPFALGFEVAGEVLEVGDNSVGFSVGDRVIAILISGGMQEEIVVSENHCWLIPDSMPFDVAASFSLTYGTSYHALVNRAQLQEGETLLVLGASGGVGSATIDIAHQLGARVIAVGSDEGKMHTLKKLYGMDEMIICAEDRASLLDQVKYLTGNKGVDVIFDPVGGDAFQQSMRLVKWNGRILIVGFASDGKNIPQASTNLLLLKGSSLLGVFWGRFIQEEREKSDKNFMRLFSWYENGKIRPAIWKRFQLHEGHHALTALIERKVVGKCVVLM